MLGVGEAFGVDAEEDGDAVAGPFGGLGGGDAGVEPGGQAGVPQVVGAFGEGRRLFGGGECGLAGFLPGAAVDARDLALRLGAVAGFVSPGSRDCPTCRFGEGWHFRGFRGWPGDRCLRVPARSGAGGDPATPRRHVRCDFLCRRSASGRPAGVRASGQARSSASAASSQGRRPHLDLSGQLYGSVGRCAIMRRTVSALSCAAMSSGAIGWPCSRITQSAYPASAVVTAWHEDRTMSCAPTR